MLRPVVHGVALLLILSFAMPWTARAQDESSPQIRVDSLNSENFPVVSAAVTVLDSNGVPVAGLPAGAFSVFDGDARLRVTGVADSTTEAAGISVVLTFDTSGSMEGTPLETAKTAGKSLIQQLGPNDHVAVISFGDTVQTVQPFTTDRAALTAAIDGLVSAGNTALYDAVASSAQLASTAGSPRRAIVLLSDGTDFGGRSVSTPDETLSAAQAARTPVFVVGLGELIDAPYLEALASATSGQLSLAPDPGTLEGLYSAIGVVLGRQHLLTFDASIVESTTQLRFEVAYAGSVASVDVPFEPPPPAVEPAPATEPVQPEPADEPVEPPVEDPVQQPGEAAGPEPAAADGAFPLLALVIALPLIVGTGGLAGFALLRRRRRAHRSAPGLPEQAYDTLLKRRQSAGPIPIHSESLPAPSAETRKPALAWLRVNASGKERSYPIDGAPVTIGFSSDCGVVLPQTSAGRFERVRVWQRDDRFMLHNLSRTGNVSVGGKPVVWTILEDGDAINIGGCTILFSSGNGEPAESF